jgi:hypothetical protein
MSQFSNFYIIIEPEIKYRYQEDSIREEGDYWVQINCADGQHLTVSNVKKFLRFTKFLIFLNN